MTSKVKEEIKTVQPTSWVLLSLLNIYVYLLMLCIRSALKCLFEFITWRLRYSYPPMFLSSAYESSTRDNETHSLWKQLKAAEFTQNYFDEKLSCFVNDGWIQWMTEKAAGTWDISLKLFLLWCPFQLQCTSGGGERTSSRQQDYLHSWFRPLLGGKLDFPGLGPPSVLCLCRTPRLCSLNSREVSNSGRGGWRHCRRLSPRCFNHGWPCSSWD